MTNMLQCIKCGKHPAASAIALCASCLREYPSYERILQLHAPYRKQAGLPAHPPDSADGLLCAQCSNRCSMGRGDRGYCGLRENREGRLREMAPEGHAFAHLYYDPLPTNCCAAWFCRGSDEQGVSLAVFLYGCNFDCLFCQNYSHKHFDSSQLVTVDDVVRKAVGPKVRCVCFFGGSPEPQLPFALRAAKKIFDESGGRMHICWEWNGCGKQALVDECARLSALSGGTVKFDLKAFHPNIRGALCGVETGASFDNFRRVFSLCPERDMLTATTLLVPWYVDSEEVGAVAKFISEASPDIPYSLLVFHPDLFLDDLPVTPKAQVYACFDAAKEHLNRVNIGNRELL